MSESTPSNTTAHPAITTLIDDTIVHLALFGGVSLGNDHPAEPRILRRRHWTQG